MKFAKQWAQEHSKAEFIEQHKHLADKAELGQAWEDLQPKKKEKAKALPAPEEGK